MITNFTVYRDRRNEKPCKQDDPFSVPVPVEVGCQKHIGDWTGKVIDGRVVQVDNFTWDIRAYATQNIDPQLCDIYEDINCYFDSVRSLFKKGEEIDLTEEERNKVIEAFESRTQE